MSNSESPISIDEHLSALLDDAAGAFEKKRVLDELKINKNLSQKLSNYALIGETMRTGDAEKPVISLGSSFLDGIHEKLEHEDEFSNVVINDGSTQQSSINNSSKNPFSWLRPIGGFAVAASLGAVAFMGLQNIGVLNNPASQPGGIVDSSAPTAIVQSTPTTDEITEAQVARVSTNSDIDDQYIDADIQTRTMLKRYVDTHMQYATTSAFVPSVRVIAYTDNQ